MWLSCLQQAVPMRFWQDLSLSAVLAGFVTVLVGFTSSAVIVFQAAASAGAGPAEIASWMWALGLGMGLTCIGLSLAYRQPVVTAWSTPGAALLITATAGLPLDQAIGAFMVSALLITLAGFTGLFERLMRRIPLSLASAMLAGVLLRFGLDVFTSLSVAPAIVLPMCAAYLAGRLWWPRYAVPLTGLAGMLAAAGTGSLSLSGLTLELARPVLTWPAFSLPALVGVALPLFAVTMASQNVPGVAVIRASGYSLPVSPLVGWSGLANLLLAPFGAFALNLAAITAAICMGREAHEDPARRYVAAVAAGGFYLLTGIFGATVGALFAAFPPALVLALAGLALLGTIGNGLAAALRDEHDREAALVTFLVTASGLTVMGIGSAFWGLVAGTVTLPLLHYGQRRQAAR
ncbi:benzoate/H(+) symporter BenE family transporter [Laribacter hongkongensis]|uniref:benzoate/H(+) symporter BenE family transporter n=1 Tax=Laribacter hongkongensis TaxID=168471 RepID=UPI0027E5373B|nr:benzoate/H(+) symporter BenE family transporter [Laribacter hongkongensis]MCG9032005.1 benzoate/H(+) symporter BenE family transporter [Laribacter hongkongensis]MCG9091523.1 benzoate/H(+) symporter BenE family transporter [Laribacter hongkongensis]